MPYVHRSEECIRQSIGAEAVIEALLIQYVPKQRRYNVVLLIFNETLLLVIFEYVHASTA